MTVGNGFRKTRTFRSSEGVREREGDKRFEIDEYDASENIYLIKIQS